MIEKEAIKAAFAAIADETVSPEPVRAALAARVRHHRQRRLILRTAGVGVAAAAAGITGLGVQRLWQPPGMPFPEVAGGPGGGWLEVPLRYSPGWLPSRFGQSRIQVGVLADQAPMVSRWWQRHETAGRYTPTIELMVGWHDAFGTRPTGRTVPVTVNNVAGQVVIQQNEDGAATYLSWQPPGEPQLMVTVISNEEPDAQREEALRVARSVRPDPRRTSVGPRFGWLPADLTASPWRFSVDYVDTAWVETVTNMPSRDAEGGRALVVQIGQYVHRGLFNESVARPIRVRGLDGWQAPENQQLFLTLPDGVQVFLQLDPSGQSDVIAELVRIAEELTFGPWPDMSWVGSR